MAAVKLDGNSETLRRICGEAGLLEFQRGMRRIRKGLRIMGMLDNGRVKVQVNQFEAAARQLEMALDEIGATCSLYVPGLDDGTRPSLESDRTATPCPKKSPKAAAIFPNDLLQPAEGPCKCEPTVDSQVAAPAAVTKRKGKGASSLPQQAVPAMPRGISRSGIVPKQKKPAVAKSSRKQAPRSTIESSPITALGSLGTSGAGDEKGQSNKVIRRRDESLHIAFGRQSRLGSIPVGAELTVEQVFGFKVLLIATRDARMAIRRAWDAESQDTQNARADSQGHSPARKHDVLDVKERRVNAPQRRRCAGPSRSTGGRQCRRS